MTWTDTIFIYSSFSPRLREFLGAGGFFSRFWNASYFYEGGHMKKRIVTLLLTLLTVLSLLPTVAMAAES
ncbi:hypothetical protein, partial [Dialister hominis]|uniref:hypothetical protein n=1 Tax=Dialister hominis TaxID=2582419 RepID=UPI00307D3A9E